MALFSTNHTLTQGSLHYRLATLGYQKQKAMGFVNLQTSYAPLSLLKEMKSKKAQHLWRCVPHNTLTQGSSLRSPTLGYQKQKAMGFVNLQTSFAPLFLLKWLSKAEGDGGSSICKHPLRPTSF